MRILIVEASDIYRHGLKFLLEQNFRIDEVRWADSYPSLTEKINSHKWDIIIADIEFPDYDGLETLKYITGAQENVPVLVVTSLSPELYAVRVFRAGAAGFLSKLSKSNDFIEAVKNLLAGKKHIPDYAADQLSTQFERSAVNPLNKLSDREHFTFMRIAEGKTVGEIARELSLSVKTISQFRKNVLVKMKLKNNASIMRYALLNNLVK